MEKSKQNETYSRPELEFIELQTGSQILEDSGGNGTGNDWGNGGED